jgi:DNA repair protein RadC
MATYTVKTVSVSVSEHPSPQAGDVTFPRCNQPINAVLIVRHLLADLDADQEHFLVITLDAKHRFSGFKVLSSGTETQCPVSPARLFRAALALDGTGIIIAHNHPSGDVEPSLDDLELTRRIAQGARLVGLDLLDHIIAPSPAPANTDTWTSVRNRRPDIFSTGS